jgi:methyl-accepting chemotaxis protein
VASQEQSAGVGEINKAVVQMEGVTQQNAALVEQATAAILSFEEEANRLAAAVSKFKLAASARPARPARQAEPVKPVKPVAHARAMPRELAPRLPAARAPKRALSHSAAASDEWKEF